MKRLVSTSFRRRFLLITSLVGGLFLVTVSSYIFHLEEDLIYEEYAHDLMNNIPSIINELSSSDLIPNPKEWHASFPIESDTFSIAICDNENNELWRSMNEQSRQRLIKQGLKIPHTENFCIDPLLPQKINSLQLIQTKNGNAFIVHVIAMRETKYSPEGRIILFKRMESKISLLNELKSKVVIYSLIVSLLVVAFIWFIYQWGFGPFKKLEKELLELKANKKTKLTNRYPEDLAPITNALNELMFQQKENEQRYRRALNDLAHSLKTRVAVSQALLDDIHDGKIGQINQQLLEMDDVIQGQLKRAALGVKGIIENTTPIRPILNSLLLMFDKVHIDKNIQTSLFINQDQTLPLSKTDAMEVFGNILENAYRYADTRIDIFISNHEEGIIITFNNDGPAIDETLSNDLFKRGVRADEKNPGTGLGLALCDEIIHSYKGAIWFETPTDPSMVVSLKILLPYRT